MTDYTMSKYIDAELIQKEIERQIMGIIKKQDANPDMPKYRWYLYEGMKEAFNDIGDFLDTLPDEPEQPTRGYDEAYLNEKISKASKSWKGVDVDKFMDEIRVREPVTDCHDLEEAAETKYPARWKKYPNDGIVRSEEYFDLNAEKRDAFKAGAKWQKRKMMDDAYEEEVKDVYRDDDGIHCCVSVGTDYKPGTIVYVITIPKEEGEK